MALDGWKERLFRRYLFHLCRPAGKAASQQILAGAERRRRLRGGASP